MPKSIKITHEFTNKKIYYTRSVTRKFLENYNFDESSREWNKNKIKNKNCYYTYINSE